MTGEKNTALRLTAEDLGNLKEKWPDLYRALTESGSVATPTEVLADQKTPEGHHLMVREVSPNGE